MTSSKDTWTRIEPWLERALALPEAEREPYLRQHLGHDPDCLTEVLGVLGQEMHGNDSFLRTPLDDFAPRMGPEKAGPFRLVRLLGQGGMGSVWLGEREEGGFAQRVAVKLLRADLDRSVALARFLQERRMLALLEHPGIARLVDGGVAQDGSPYLAMEYVEGVTLDRFAVEQGLDLRKRLELLLSICEALQAAHTAGIVHRDLKPHNILVTQGGRPRVIDFGIASYSGLEEDVGQLTATGERLMTPRYAAPEQVRGEPVSVATDVHALGGLLYELLTDRPPVGPEATTMAEIEDAVLNEDTPPPSRNPAPAVGSIERDLDLVVARARASEPHRRYADVAAFADDLCRFLDGHPILARPDSRVYRARRFVGRHRGLVGAACGVVVALATGMGVSLYQYRIAEAQRVVSGQALEQVGEQRNVAESVQSFMTRDLLLGANPQESGSPDLTLREAMQRAEPRISERFAESPLAEAAIRHSYGNAYLGLSLPTEALPHLERAYDLREAKLGPDALETLECARDLGRALDDCGRLEESIVLYRETHARMVRLFGADDGYTLVLASNLAQALSSTGQVEKSVELMREVLELRRSKLGADHVNTLNSMNTLAVALTQLGKYDEALPLLEAVSQKRSERLGKHDAATLRSLGNLAAARVQLGQHAEARATFEDIWKAQSSTLGPHHAETLTTLRNLGAVSYFQGEHSSVIEYMRKEWSGHRARGDGAGPRGSELLDGLVDSAQRAGEIEEVASQLESWLLETDPDLESELYQALDQRLVRALALLEGS